MIRTLEGPGIAGFLAAYHRTAMSTRIEQRADRAVVAADQNHGTARDVARTKITGVRHLRFMTGVDPALVEQPTPFLLEAFGIGEYPPVYTEKASRLVIDDEGFVRFFH